MKLEEIITKSKEVKAPMLKKESKSEPLKLLINRLKKSDRDAKQGLIEAYIHNNGKVGVLLELNCETDFVARNEEFKKLAHDLAMHIAAMNPENTDEFLGQPFIKDESKKIDDVIKEAVGKIGENIKIGRFVRLDVSGS